jgi:TetR/AcrR family transcriptional regulator, tetracycline repressor protein
VSHALPPPIWSRRTPASRPPVSEEAIIQAALGLLDDAGLDAVTMRGVAERMGVSAPTVYWHVTNKDGLLDRLYDRLCSEVPPPPPGPWQDRLRSLANDIRAVFAAHRDAARMAIGRFPLGPHGLRVTETALAALADAGLGDEDAAHAAHLFFSYVTSFSYQETILPAPAPAGDRAGALSQVGQYLSSLSPDDFPHLTRCASALARPGLDRRFAFGLDHLIRGLRPT